jgi:hypothetical protein
MLSLCATYSQELAPKTELDSLMHQFAYVLEIVDANVTEHHSLLQTTSRKIY